MARCSRSTLTAPVFKNLYSFTNGTDGSSPHGFVISGNTLYGTTWGISGNGTVFALNTNGTGFTILHSFIATNFTFSPGPAPGYTNNDGVMPCGLTLSGNTLYGTALYGGTNGNGTVFALNTNGTGFTTLHSFAATSGANYTNNDGSHPLNYTGLILSGNTLYGTAYYGGINGNGTVFALNTNGTCFTTGYNFSATNANGYNSDGAHPEAGLTLSGNTLYGTTKWGGNNGDGAVFGISLTLLVTTTSLPNGTPGVVYNQTLSAFGGQPSYSWTNISGALPPGLSLATNGVISGTPTANGTFNFTVQVTDALSATATQMLALTVSAPNLVLNGGFETGDFSGWTLSGDTSPWTYVDDGSASGIQPHSGNYVAELGTPSFLSQTLSTVAGQSYLLSLWLNSPDGLTLNEFLVSWNGNIIFDEKNIPAIGWTNLQFVVSATGNSTVLEFGFRDDPSYLGLDDISVVNLTITPSPVILSSPQITVGKTNFTFLLSGPAGSNYVLQVSTNLLNWDPISTSAIPVSGTINVTNAITNYNRRFYKVHLQ